MHEIAYEPALFERALAQLERISETDSISTFFQPFLSGTEATLDQRSALIKEYISEGKPFGFKCLEQTLKTRCTGHYINDSGAQIRSYGSLKTYTEQIEWYKHFLKVAESYAIGNNAANRQEARKILVTNIFSLSDIQELQGDLVNIVITIHAHTPWFALWKNLKVSEKAPQELIAALQPARA